jgi:hypothetical protein
MKVNERDARTAPLSRFIQTGTSSIQPRASSESWVCLIESYFLAAVQNALVHDKADMVVKVLETKAECRVHLGKHHRFIERTGFPDRPR